MVRTYHNKTNRANISEDDVKKAIIDVIKNKKTIRQAAVDHGLKKSMLFKRIKVVKQHNPDLAKNHESDSGNSEIEDEIVSVNIIDKNKYKGQQIFTDTEEEELCAYFKKCSRIHYGLTYLQARKLAYEYAKRLNKSYPSSWDTNRQAGVDWIKIFMKRHSTLSLRKPENTSMARATAFNKSSVEVFFKSAECYGSV